MIQYIQCENVYKIFINLFFTSCDHVFILMFEFPASKHFKFKGND